MSVVILRLDETVCEDTSIEGSFCISARWCDQPVQGKRIIEGTTFIATNTIPDYSRSLHLAIDGSSGDDHDNA